MKQVLIALLIAVGCGGVFAAVVVWTIMDKKGPLQSARSIAGIAEVNRVLDGFRASNITYRWVYRYRYDEVYMMGRTSDVAVRSLASEDRNLTLGEYDSPSSNGAHPFYRWLGGSPDREWSSQVWVVRGSMASGVSIILEFDPADGHFVAVVRFYPRRSSSE
jgi:hypothetical protein